MKIIKITLLFLFAFISHTYAQDFPKNPEAGKCYERCFDYDKRYKWREIDCDLQKTLTEKLKKEDANPVIKEQKRLKLLAYQSKLVELGYDCDATGTLNDKFFKAHHRYLIDQKKRAKRAAKLARKAKRKNKNENN